MSLRIAIVGGGIGGLTLALALRAHGMEAAIYEQAHELAEIGAAVALSANATREFRRLGVLEGVLAASTEPTELIYRDGRTGERIAAHPGRVGGNYRRLCGAPYCGIHRADLQRVLSGAVGSGPIHLGHRLVSIEDGGREVALGFDNGARVAADLVVGADGIRSPVRRHVVGADAIRYSGTSGFRGIVPTDRLPSLPDPHAIQFWVGPGAHVLHYAIGGDSSAVNFLAVVEGPAQWPGGDRWQMPAAPGEAQAAFAGWHGAIGEMIAAQAPAARWGLFTTRPLASWFRGRVVLLGDAAHAMLPHHGQGANTTIEDAVTLAEKLPGARPDRLAPLLAEYQALRRARTRKIQHSSWTTNRLLHLPDGADLAARDRRFAGFAQDFAWIHRFDAVAAASATHQHAAA